MKREWLWAVAGAVLFGAVARGSARAEEGAPQSVQERLEILERKQAILERKWENDQEAVATKEKESASGTANAKDGFTLKSADGNFRIKFAGYIQADSRFYLSDQPRTFTDTFLFRRIRPSLEGKVHKYVDFRILPDFAGSALIVQDAYLDLKYWTKASLRVGKFKQPFGLERLQSGTSLLFVERAFPTSLAPNRDVGVQLYGEFWIGALAYQAGVFNGVVDGGSADTDTNDDKEVVGRVFVLPFKNGNGLLFKDLGAGFAYSKSTLQGNTTTTGLTSYRTDGQQTFLSYRSDVVADGARTRWSPQAYWYPGRWGFLGEYVSSSQDVKRATTTTTFADLENRAWQVAVNYVVTGEKTSFKGIKPRTSFDPAAHTWGALELAVRYSEFLADDDAFAGSRYANPATAARSARALTGGFNWTLNAGVKVTTDYAHTRFSKGATTGNRDDERTFLSRFQFSF